MDTEALAAAGQIGGRTVQINGRGEVECARYPLAALDDGSVRIRTVRSAISPGTEMTFYGKGATNVYLHKTWNEELRLFVKGAPSISYPIVFGYRAAGEVVESDSAEAPVGSRVYGNWRHTEYTTLPGQQAAAQLLPETLSFDDGVDVAQMGPICVNAVAYAETEHDGAPAVVFGAGPVGLITAQVVRATGAREVVVVDRLASRLRIADDLGLGTLDGSVVDDVAVELKTRFGSEGIPVAFECSGSTLALHEAIRVVRRRGTVVAAGFYQGDGRGLLLGDEFHHNGIQVRCGQIGNLHPDWSWDALRARVVELATSGALRLGGLPRLTVAVEDAAGGFRALTRPAEVLQVQLAYEPL